MRKQPVYTMDKAHLISTLRADMEAERAMMTRIAREAAEAATHEDNRPESDKDMRSTEASYLARGQAARVKMLEQSLARLTTMEVLSFENGAPIAVSAVVDLSDGTRERTYFVVPPGVEGGRRVSVEDREVQTLSPTSPLGRSLIGRQVRDEVEVQVPQGLRSYEVLAIS